MADTREKPLNPPALWGLPERPYDPKIDFLYDPVLHGPELDPNRNSPDTLLKNFAQLNYPEGDSDTALNINGGDFWWILYVTDESGSFLPDKAAKLPEKISYDELQIKENRFAAMSAFYRIVFGVLRGEDLSHMFTENELSWLETDVDTPRSAFSGIVQYDASSLLFRVQSIFNYYCLAKGIPVNALYESAWNTLHRMLDNTNFVDIDHLFDIADETNSYGLPVCYDQIETQFYPGKHRALTLNFPGDFSEYACFTCRTTTPMIILPTNSGDTDLLYYILDPTPAPDIPNEVYRMRQVVSRISAFLSIQEDCFRYKTPKEESWTQITEQGIYDLFHEYWDSCVYLHLDPRYDTSVGKNNFCKSVATITRREAFQAIKNLKQVSLFAQKHPGLLKEIQSGAYFMNPQPDIAASSKTRRGVKITQQKNKLKPGGTKRKKVRKPKKGKKVTYESALQASLFFQE